MNRFKKAEWLLLLVAVVWGSGFTLSKNALSCTNPMTFIGFRFSAAFLFLCLANLVRTRKLPFHAWRCALKSGICLFLALMLQTVALRYTSASRVAFIAGLNCIIVPFLYSVLHRKTPGKNVVFGAFFSACGLFFLCDDASVKFNIGDLIAVFAAFLFAIQILSVATESKKAPPDHFIFSEIFVCAVLSMLSAHFLGERNTDFTALRFWNGVLITGIFCTAVAFFIQGKFQKETTPSKAAVIFATEPGFGLLFSVIIPNAAGEVEKLTGNALAGCLFLFLGIIFSEISNKSEKIPINT